jgi:hypothetical protein
MNIILDSIQEKIDEYNNNCNLPPSKYLMNISELTNILENENLPINGYIYDSYNKITHIEIENNK